MNVRYYADADIQELHGHMLRLLRTLHDEHGITVEIERIDEQHGPLTDFPGDVRYPSPEEVYERDLKRNRELMFPEYSGGSNVFIECGETKGSETRIRAVLAGTVANDAVEMGREFAG
jgi:hypothetical protein